MGLNQCTGAYIDGLDIFLDFPFSKSNRCGEIICHIKHATNMLWNYVKGA